MAPLTPIELPSGRKIGPGESCFVVAEIGQNHQGDAYTALRLIKAAHDAGVDAVKMCKRHIPSELTREAYCQPYDNPNSFGATYGEHREALELSIEEYKHLQSRIEYNKWPEVFFSTVCDIHSVHEIEEHIDPPVYKIASRDIDNLPLIERVCRTWKPIILSTGMATDEDIQAALATVRRHHNRIVLLYCVSEYPTPLEHIDLARLFAMERECGSVGFSHHTGGIVAAQAAALLGACIVEVHCTLARVMKGTDHAASLEPDGLARLVRNIRAGETLLRPVNERPEVPRRKLGRSIVAACNIAPGAVIAESYLVLKSPGTGLRWRERDKILGKTASRHIEADTLITEEDVTEAAEVTSGSV